jgi:hypothetical protein
VKVYGILLSYYPEYHDNIRKRFSKVLKRVSNNYEIIEIINNGEIISSLSEGCLPGDNRYWEFSGWQVGLDSIRHKLNDDDVVVFANDTFDRHRFFFTYDRYLFARAVLSAVRSSKKMFLVGELCNPIGKFSILNECSDGWVSTYLFAVSGCFMKRTSLLHYAEKELESLVRVSEAGGVELLQCSDNLKNYLMSWLGLNGATAKWIPRREDKDVYRAKLLAILNEKRLSIMMNGCGGTMVDIYNNSRMYYRVRRRLFNRVNQLREVACRVSGG